MNHLFIINPQCGQKNHATTLKKKIDTIHTVMQPRNEPYFIEQTSAPLDAQSIARRYCEQSTDPLRIYVYGGDGTLNEVINGVSGFDHVAVSLIPCGKNNNFIKVFGSSSSRFAELTNLLDSPQLALDLIDCNGRLGCNVASIGVDVALIAAEKRNRHRTRFRKHLHALRSLCKVILHTPPTAYHVTLDSLHLEDSFSLITCLNGRCYGNEFTPISSTTPNDHLLNFVLMKRAPRLQLIALLYQYFYGSRDYASETPTFFVLHQGYSLEVSSQTPMTAQLDGELLSDTRFCFRLSDKKLNFFYPRGATVLPSLAIRPNVSEY